MGISKRRTICRLCNSDDLVLVLPIRPSPIADAFVSEENKNIVQPLISLDLYQCQCCGHVQNLDIVNPDLLFREYIFTTSSSAGLVEHFKKYAEDVVKDFDIQPKSLVVEIGSNDGTLLKFMKGHELEVLGVDPAIEIAAQATASGVRTIPDFFTDELALKIKSEHGPAKLFVANNVFAHADNLASITKGIATLLDDDGIFVFEVSYLLDIVDKFLFDTVYHEHLSYHSIEPFTKFFSRHGLHLFNVQRILSKGGSMRGFVQKVNGAHKEQPVIQAMIAEEVSRGLHKPKIFHDYETQIIARKQTLLDVVNNALASGKKVVAYGASTTVTTLMYHFELEDKLEYLIDDNPKKHGMFSPGCHLEVKPSSILYDSPPDMVIVLAWQYANPIISKHDQFVENGGTFVIPLTALKVIQKG
jgi:SAM-dependent methyltransferase